jgi:hypothetical protein
LKTVLGLQGGPIGSLGLVGTQAKISPSILRTKTRMSAVAVGQEYEVDVDRLGVQVPHTVTNEDVTIWFTK